MTDTERELLRSVARGSRILIPPSISSSYRAYMTRVGTAGKHEVSRYMVDTLIQDGFLVAEPFDYHSTTRWVWVTLTDQGRAELLEPV